MKNFQPKPTAIVMAMWEYMERLSPPLLPTAGIHWGVFVQSGGPAKYIGRTTKASRG